MKLSNIQSCDPLAGATGSKAFSDENKNWLRMRGDTIFADDGEDDDDSDDMPDDEFDLGKFKAIHINPHSLPLRRSCVQDIRVLVHVSALYTYTQSTITC